MSDESTSFRFQKLLEIKEKREQSLQMEIARIDRAVSRLQDSRDEFMRLRDGALETLREARDHEEFGVNQQYTAYLRHVRARIKDCKEETSRLEQEREKVRRKLEEIMKSRKLLEQYKEKLDKQSQQDLERFEEKVLDAYSQRQFLRDNSVL